VTPEMRPKFAKGVRLHRDRDGGTMLLVPEGALALNASAAAALELVDGQHSIGEIETALVAGFEVDAKRAHDDVCELFERLAERRFVEMQ